MLPEHLKPKHKMFVLMGKPAHDNYIVVFNAAEGASFDTDWDKERQWTLIQISGDSPIVNITEYTLLKSDLDGSRYTPVYFAPVLDKVLDTIRGV